MKTNIQEPVLANLPDERKEFAGKAQTPKILRRSLTGFFLAGMLPLIFAACKSDKPDSTHWTAEYAIGDTGPGGGKIFYVDQSDEGFISAYDGSVCHYLEVSPSDMGPYTWITSGYDPLIEDEIAVAQWLEIGQIEGIDGVSIGTGRKNTRVILAYDASAPAALACVSLNAGGKSDWFLPSEKELTKLFEFRSFLDMSNGPAYWSSSMTSMVEANKINFSGFVGNIGKDYMSASHYVRAVRAF